jgi:hypothetical protein
MKKVYKSINDDSNELLKIYTHQIRNMIALDKDMIENVSKMTSEDKLDIIVVLNDMLVHLIDILDGYNWI